MKNNKPEEKIVVVFRNDDPSAVSDVEHEKRIADIFIKYGVPQSIGVVPLHTLGNTHSYSEEGVRPLYDNGEMVEFLTAYAKHSGSEIALHGFNHKTNRLSIPSKREYFEFRGLDADEQEKMIKTGTDIIEECLCIRPITFIPPWNRMDGNTLIALERQGYTAISAEAYEKGSDRIVSFGTNCNPVNFNAVYKAAKLSPSKIFLNIYYHSVTTVASQQIAALEHAVKTIAEDSNCEILTIGDACKKYSSELRRVNDAAKNTVPFDQVPGSLRAKSAVYYKVYSKINRNNSISSIQHQCRQAYLSGNYEQSIALTPDIERKATALLWSGRLIFLCIGAFVSGVLSLAMDKHLMGLVLILVASAGIGFMLRQKATAPKSKTEMTIASLSLVGGVILGWFV